MIVVLCNFSVPTCLRQLIFCRKLSVKSSLLKRTKSKLSKSEQHRKNLKHHIIRMFGKDVGENYFGDERKECYISGKSSSD